MTHRVYNVDVWTHHTRDAPPLDEQAQEARRRLARAVVWDACECAQAGCMDSLRYIQEPTPDLCLWCDAAGLDVATLNRWGWQWQRQHMRKLGYPDPPAWVARAHWEMVHA